jgi:hypothetical protein
VDASGSGYFVVNWWFLNKKPFWLGESKREFVSQIIEAQMYK